MPREPARKGSSAKHATQIGSIGPGRSGWHGHSATGESRRTPTDPCNCSIPPSCYASCPASVWTRPDGSQRLRLELEPELHGQPPRSLGTDLWRFGQALIRPDDVHHGVDEREVGERLREVAQVASAVRLDLLGVEQQRAGVGEQLLAQRPGPVQLADLGERRDEPERADRERALLTRQPVVGLLHAVAQHQAVDRQLVGDRQDGRPHALVGRAAGSG